MWRVGTHSENMHYVTPKQTHNTTSIMYMRLKIFLWLRFLGFVWSRMKSLIVACLSCVELNWLVSCDSFTAVHVLCPYKELISRKWWFIHAERRWTSFYSITGCDPHIMGIGPVPAIRHLLAKTGYQLSDIDIFEVWQASVCFKGVQGKVATIGHLFRAPFWGILTTILNNFITFMNIIILYAIIDFIRLNFNNKVQ